MAGGAGVFVQQTIYEAIPEAYRPSHNTDEAMKAPEVLFGGVIDTVGITVMPFILVDRKTSTSFGLKMRALVAAKLLLGIFIGSDNNILNG
jgi:hypothetical protein